MTAIAGLWNFASMPRVRIECERMLTAQALYGPDAVACWSAGDIALGRRLFEVLPEDRYDDDLQFAAGGTLVLAADVRLDNREDLIRALNVEPSRARALCDAAVLAAACERWGEEVVDHLSGDFAFAMWDAGKRRLLLARDFMGHRPLHFHRGNGFFAFASMPKGLHALAQVPMAPDSVHAAEFLTLMPQTGTGSFFAGIERLPAGHFALVTEQGVTLHRYWQPTRSTVRMRNADAYAEALRHHLDEAVRVRLRSARAVGAHLSGGLDSAIVATSAAMQLAAEGRRLAAFTGVPRDGYDGPVPAGRIADEGPLAAATAALHPNIDHLRVGGSARSPLDSLDRYFHLFEQPMLNLCNGWALEINETARTNGVSVMLNAQMGNMSVSYDGMQSLPEMFGGGRWVALIREARALVRNRQMRWRGVAAASVGPFLPDAVWKSAGRLAGRALPDVRVYTAINVARFQELDLAQRARRRGLDFSYRPRRDGFGVRLWVLQRMDLGNYNKGVLGGWGIDLRDPMADRKLVEFCLSVPSSQYLSRGVPRALARRAFAGRLPAQVLSERRRGLQGADWHEGLDLARDAASDELERLDGCGPARETLDLARLRQLTTDWPSSGWDREDVVQNYRLALLRGLSVGHFLRKATRSNR